MATSTRPTCLELFAGCGGLGYGFHKAGFNIVCANELEPTIAKTYEANFPDTNVISGDITKDDIKERMYECFEGTECDVIIGGPPCVAYSMAGRRNSRDPRGQLYRDYVEIVRKLRPKAFVMENVKGILTILHDKPELTAEEQGIADTYYEIEARRQELLEKRKALTIKKETHTSEFNQVKTDLKNVTALLKRRKDDLSKFRVNVTDIIKQDFRKLG
jgi:site-specific DNA-cytosine methylase